jgi:DNA-binding transcriptional LysR family regulator
VLRIERSDFELIYAISLGSSLSAAAQRLGVTKPAVSQRLTRLEEIIGQTLVKRGIPVQFTKAGERMLAAAKVVVFGVAALESDLCEIGTGTIPLKIMTNLSVAIDDLPHVIERMKSDSPKLNITIHEGVISETLSSVLNKSMDVGIVFNIQSAPGLRYTPYRRERFFVIAPLSHPLSNFDEISLLDASGHDFIGTGRSHNITAIIESEIQHSGRSIHYAMHTSSYEMQAHFVGTTNIGIAIVLGNVAKRYERIYPIKAIALTDAWASGEYVIVTKDTEPLSIQCNNFIKLMQFRFNDLSKR